MTGFWTCSESKNKHIGLTKWKKYQYLDGHEKMFVCVTVSFDFQNAFDFSLFAKNDYNRLHDYRKWLILHVDIMKFIFDLITHIGVYKMIRLKDHKYIIKIRSLNLVVNKYVLILIQLP